ncbi:hypothetical protein QQS21_007294 [Conoideocrella luteorostrata]|uniref:Uracil-DNA glycosylase-like domain-containing protein n=1 Tax=Conoideocrella luteorostrata TaxID=1105319 RepID=A0AAJ0FSK4_9HYPO|nr:hypothetical protein QQS21_007294 [Conoideocrella luteorostrata]
MSKFQCNECISRIECIFDSVEDHFQPQPLGGKSHYLDYICSDTHLQLLNAINATGPHAFKILAMEGEQQHQHVATFKGRLQLDAFRYTSPEGSVRRNPPRAATSPIVRTAFPRTARLVKLEANEPHKASSQPQTSSSSRKRSSGSQSQQSPTKKKRSRPSTGYAPPSKYAHLPFLPDAFAPNLLVLFVGLNPGISTALTGHAYAHPSNLFWKLLYSSGVTPRRCYAEEDRQMPELYSLGLTNIVGRPSRNGSELSKAEMDDGVAALEEKAREWRPESMCIVGKSIWESIWRVRHRSPVGKKFRYGWQDEQENMGVVKGEWEGARVFVASSTSGLAATLLPAEKEKIWAELGSWVKMRRAEREADGDKQTVKEELES